MNRTQICVSESLTSALIAFSFFGVTAVPQSSPVKPTLRHFASEVSDAPQDVVVVGPVAYLAAELSGSVHLVARKSIDENKPEITIFVTNTANVGPSELLKSKAQATQIFRESGVSVAWIDCVPGTAQQINRDPIRLNQFVVHVMPRGQTSSDSVIGLSFLGTDGIGAYSDVFYDRIQQMHRDSGVDGPRLLGTVIAHEIGHLLLGLHAHSAAGIMRAHWSKEEIRLIGLGCLGFTPDQSSRMRSRIAPPKSDNLSFLRARHACPELPNLGGPVFPETRNLV